LSLDVFRLDPCQFDPLGFGRRTCSSIRRYMKRHHTQSGVGHYGVFSGKKWEGQIYPLLKNVVLSSD
jgi:poly-beta-hydroxyalkanoate depolymerase